ncbi:MAG TPA: FAD-dependent oxidoreductase [Nocardioides sp.]|nr:FAD-dependent oxidoreductase [Nocardioides sp.]
MTVPASSYDVVIVGAGICGLNAAFVAAERLGKRGRIALVDSRHRAGGMWNDAYDYVRLHQPHPLFTAGDIKWRWDKEPTHLASKPEVLDHLGYCLGEIEKRTHVEEYFGWSYDAHEESDGRVCTTIHRGGERVVLESGRLVKALGFNVETNDPLQLTSAKVRSVSPDTCDVRAGEIAASDTPVWIVGGGKTAMDTAYALLTADPRREVSLLAGSGTWFVRRDALYHPDRPLRGGVRPNAWGEELAMSYDGTNEASVFSSMDGLRYIKVTPAASNFMIGLLSDAEADRIRDGLTQNRNDHLEDVVDAADGPQLVLRCGERVAVPEGTWVVNCTGYLLRGGRPYEPFASASGRVLSIGQRSSVLTFTSYEGYLLTHLLMRGKLARLPLVEIDWTELRARYGSGTTPAAWTVLMHNFTILALALPPQVFLRMGVDADHWYPLIRRQIGLLRFLMTRRRQREHYARTIATVRERYDIRLGPLDHAA